MVGNWAKENEGGVTVGRIEQGRAKGRRADRGVGILDGIIAEVVQVGHGSCEFIPFKELSRCGGVVSQTVTRQTGGVK
jgi:hypothetical protein